LAIKRRKDPFILGRDLCNELIVFVHRVMRLLSKPSRLFIPPCLLVLHLQISPCPRRLARI